jgi:nucleoside-diphosphate-sugar epimerase
VQALVTGATGFVGGALTRKLLADGHAVRALRGPHTPADPQLAERGAQVLQADLGDPNAIADAARDCELVFHCAGESSPRAAPDALAWINVAGTENVISAARHAGVARVVMLSCADASLVDRDRVHWKEDAVLGRAPLGAYARSKLLAEELALQASDRSLCVTALRPAFLWGPGDRTNLPALCREARSGGVRLYGRGEHLFSAAYIDNVVAALLLAARADGVAGQAFHVADAEFLTAREFFTKLCSAAGLPPPRSGLYALAYGAALLNRALARDAPLPEEIARRGRASLLDCLRAVSVLDYKAPVSLEAGLEALSGWAKQVGGPTAIERLARPPATPADAARSRALAESS